MKNCIYCKAQLSDESAIEVCNLCGHQVWGEKMFQAIIDNMENAKETGDLYQGSVTETQETKIEEPTFTEEPTLSEDTEYKSL